MLKIRRYWIALALRQVLVLTIFLAGASLYRQAGGGWIGWPTVILLSIVLNGMWCFVA